jgi:hypothetical protein
MRTKFPFIIFLFSISAFAIEDDIYTSRGLKNNNCYRENSKYECSQDCKKCTLHIFPDIKAQISISANDLKDYCKYNKTDTGLTSFKFYTEKQQAKVKVYGFIKVKKELSESWAGQSNLKLNPITCPKN